jgi:hypothetical protein
MCLDIDPDSVIHKHLVKKVTDLTVYTGSTFNEIISKEFPENSHDHHGSKHNLTMLDSFHISLGIPNFNDNPGDSITLPPTQLDIRSIIGDIILADIHTSKKDNKKSAWIPLYRELVEDLLPHYYDLRTYVNPDNPNAFNHQMLHISLANLTGNPHDSIARPEDCIIDTITA